MKATRFLNSRDSICARSWVVLSKSGRVMTDVEAPNKNTVAFWDGISPRTAPHRLARLAIVETTHPTTPTRGSDE